MPSAPARLAAEVGPLAAKESFAEWIEAEADDAGLEPYVLAAFAELRTAALMLD